MEPNTLSTSTQLHRLLGDTRINAVYRFWRSLCRGSLPTSRFDLDPAPLSEHLPHVFILEREDNHVYRYRLAGSKMCQVFGRQLRRHSFFTPWNHNEREVLETILVNVCSGTFVGAVEGNAWAGGNRLTPFSLLLMPLRYRGDRVSRVLGVFTTETHPEWAQQWPLLRMSINEVYIHPWLTLDSPSAIPVRECQQHEVPVAPALRRGNLTLIHGHKP